MANAATQQGEGRPAVRLRCPACGQALHRLVDGRCELCRFQVEPSPITAEDRTPYAESAHFGIAARWRMTFWVCAAPSERVSHLALMRMSPAARRFGRGSLLLFALAAMCVLGSATGWHRAVDVDTGGGLRLEPTGKGWLLVAATPQPIPDHRLRTQAIALWWNPVMATIGAVSGLLGALSFGVLWLVSVEGGAQRSLKSPYRDQGRLSGAIRYSTAWVWLAALVSLLLILRPMWDLAEVRDWVSFPQLTALFVPIGLVVAASLLGWWTWLIRLALTVPMPTRSRSLAWMLLGPPLVTVLLLVAPAFGLWLGLKYLSEGLGLQW